MRFWQKLLVAMAVLLPIFALLYRSTLYWKIPVAPGDPYGLGDIIDAGFGLLVVAGSGLALIGAVVTLVVPRYRSARNAVILAAVGVVATVGYFWLHAR